MLALVAGEELQGGDGPGVEGIVVLDKTPFYAEMGGQVADHGTLENDGFRFQVSDVQKNKGGKYMHYGRVLSGNVKVGDTVTASIDAKRRRAIQRAHSATHLLHKALRTVLGDHVQQAGSLVEPGLLRFDFTHFSAMTPEELSEVNRLVNESILEGYPVDTKVMDIEEAKKTGATALFGEKYGDTVRVVDMGRYSVEFCGGTHLDNTAKVGVFHIDSEFSVASGVRRIEATTGQASLDVMDRNQELLFQTAAALKAKPGELREKAEHIMTEMKELRQSLEKFRAKEALGEAERFLFSGHDVGGLKVLTATVPDADANRLRKMGDFLRDKEPNVVAVLASVNGEEDHLPGRVRQGEAVKRGVKAGDIVKQVSAIAGGSGGGKPDSAMGGGKDVLMLDNALAMVDNVVSMKLGL